VPGCPAAEKFFRGGNVVDRRVIDGGSRTGWLAAALCAGLLLTGCAAPARTASAPDSSTATVVASPTEPSEAAADTGSPTVEQSSSLQLVLPPEVTSTSAVATASGSAGGSTAPPLPDCTGGGLPTVTPGTLTIGTGTPTASPWFVGAGPSSGEGLESAVAYALAAALGYDREHVVWTTVDRGQAIAGTAGGFDLDFDQFTAPDVGTVGVDYSTGYFPVTDALVMRQGPGLPTSTSALSGLSLAAATGGSAAATVQRLTGANAETVGSAAEVLAELAAGSVSGAVLPVHAAIAVTAANPGLALVGQLPTDPKIQPDQFKVLLPAGSALTGCVSTAIDKLRVEGALDGFANQWVTPVAPTLN
jgi:polar amino acid transport system substrate-binding protein